MNVTDKKILNQALEKHTPDGWANLIELKIDDPIVRSWMANIILHNWRRDVAYGTRIEAIADAYQASDNELTAQDLKAAHEALGLPHSPCASDDSQPSGKKRAVTHDEIRNSQRVNHEEAQRYCNFHHKEKGGSE